ncbi:MAG: hypothetical protein M3326_11360 [Actinomycetota bacterium]|nr:hypothetical protein [Actinomycetota bacterium]
MHHRFRIDFPWGLGAQVLSSATNVGLWVVSGRALGPSGLGVVSLGFATYLVAQGLQRALLTDPLMVSVARRGDQETRVVLQYGFALALISALVFTTLITIVAVVAGGTFGHALLLFAPWVGAALVHDFWRWSLFGANRAQTATATDGTRAVVMVLILPIAFWTRSDWVVVASWGVGAFCAGALGWFKTGDAPAGMAAAYAWWRVDGLPLGRWLAVESLVVLAGGLAVTFIVAAVLGTAELGRLRAVDSIFAPMTLLGQALELPGLPRLSRLWRLSPRAARVSAARISGIALALVTAYLIIAFSLRGTITSAVFGSGFGHIDRLILPVALSEWFFAAGLGFFILLKASGRGRARLLSEIVLDATTICLVWMFASGGDIVSAAWGRTIGAAAGEVTATAAAMGSPARKEARAR